MGKSQKYVINNKSRFSGIKGIKEDKDGPYVSVQSGE